MKISLYRGDNEIITTIISKKKNDIEVETFMPSIKEDAPEMICDLTNDISDLLGLNTIRVDMCLGPGHDVSDYETYCKKKYSNIADKYSLNLKIR